ncbi:MAG: hypothetical protein IT553_05865 [Sphingomonadaceae bacterium]|nr:hypothetical protein [Sphingomonadaceae bacterium]
MNPVLAILGLPVIVAGTIFCIRYWRPIVPGVLIWALFEGAMRKWGFPQYQSIIYIAKDGVILAAFLGFLLDTRRKDFMAYVSPVFLGLIGAISIYLLFMLLNPNSPSVLLSIIGLKNHINYVPLAIMVPAVIEREEDLYRFVRLFLFLTIGLGLLGLYQFTQPASAWINQQISFDSGTIDAQSVFGAGQGSGDFKYGFVRTSSTFSYIGGFITYLILSVPMIVALILSDSLRPRDRRWAYVAIAIGLGAAFTTGARTPIFVMIIGLPLMLAIATARGLISTRLFFRLIAAGILVGLATALIFNQAIQALIFRSENADSASMRLLSPIVELANAFDTSPIFGTGLGTNSNAAPTVMQSPFQWWLNGHYYELETARVMQEVGFFGFALIFSMRIAVVGIALRASFRHRNRYFTALCLGAAFFLTVHIILFVVNNPLAGVYYYALLGMIFATNRLAALADQRARLPLPPPGDTAVIPPAGNAVPAG